MCVGPIFDLQLFTLGWQKKSRSHSLCISISLLPDDLVLRPAACCIPLAHLLPMATEMCVLKLQVDLANDGLWRL